MGVLNISLLLYSEGQTLVIELGLVREVFKEHGTYSFVRQQGNVLYSK